VSAYYSPATPDTHFDYGARRLVRWWHCQTRREHVELGAVVFPAGAEQIAQYRRARKHRDGEPMTDDSVSLAAMKWKPRVRAKWWSR